MTSYGISTQVEILSDTHVRLPGDLTLPSKCKGIVLFAHGSGSSRLSPRNIQVAQSLHDAGIGTLLFDLLTEEESESRANVFDIQLLADRLAMATRWLQDERNLRPLPFGYFGASTGAGAALWAAADLKDEIAAVVSRGGRPDLASPRLAEVTAPTLLLVGERDLPVIEMNEHALKLLPNAELKIVPKATHLFEEPGTLEKVADHAKAWFLRYFDVAQRKKPPEEAA